MEPVAALYFLKCAFLVSDSVPLDGTQHLTIEFRVVTTLGFSKYFYLAGQVDQYLLVETSCLKDKML